MFVYQIQIIEKTKQHQYQIYSKKSQIKHIENTIPRKVCVHIDDIVQLHRKQKNCISKQSKYIQKNWIPKLFEKNQHYQIIYYSVYQQSHILVHCFLVIYKNVIHNYNNIFFTYKCFCIAKYFGHFLV